MKNLQVFNYNDVELPVRTNNDGSIEFDAEQTAIGLGISQIAKSGNEVVRWERVNKYLGIPTSGDAIKRGDYISEPDFYTLAIKANNPAAQKFQYWVTHEVLPTIRKHGTYMTPDKINEILSDPDTIISLATQLKQEQEQRKQLQVENKKMQPKALFADSVTTSHTTILIGELAKILRGNGINIGQNRLFGWLRENGYLISRKGTDFNMPTQRSMDLGLFKIKETTIQHADGHVTISKTPKVTGKGQQYFVNKFLGNE